MTERRSEPAVVRARRRRRFRGVPRPPAARPGAISRHRVRADAVLPARGFADAHPELAAAVPDRRRADRRAPAGRGACVAEATWLARRTRDGRRRAPRRRHGAAIGRAPDRADHPRPAVPAVTREYLTPVKRRYLSATIPRRSGGPTVVAVPTEYVRGTVIEPTAPIRRGIVVVPHGVEPHARRGCPDEADLRAPLRRSVTGRSRASRRSPIRTRATGSCSTCWPRAWTDPDLRLVLLGGAGAPAAEVDRGDRRLGLDRRVVRPGRVPAADRDGLIAHGRGARLPQPVRGLRRARDRGDGARHAGRVQRPGRPARGGRRRRPRAARSTADAWAGALDDVARRRADARRRRPRARRDFTTARVGRGARRRLPAGCEPAMTGRLRREARRALPALRSRHRADRRRDDPHRARARRARATSCTSSRRCPGTATTRIEAGWTGRLVATRGHAVGIDHPCAPVPRRRQAQPAAPGARLRRLLARSPAWRGARSAGEPRRRRARDVAAAHPRADRLGWSSRCGAGRWCSTSRTSSPTPRSRPGRSPTAASSPSRTWLERMSYRRADAVTVLSRRSRRQRPRPSCPTAAARPRCA